MERSKLERVYFNDGLDGPYIRADDANEVMDTMEARIKALEYQVTDKGRKNSELFSTNAELRKRIKELEERLKEAK